MKPASSDILLKQSLLSMIFAGAVSFSWAGYSGQAASSLNDIYAAVTPSTASVPELKFSKPPTDRSYDTVSVNLYSVTTTQTFLTDLLTVTVKIPLAEIVKFPSDFCRPLSVNTFDTLELSRLATILYSFLGSPSNSETMAIWENPDDESNPNSHSGVELIVTYAKSARHLLSVYGSDAQYSNQGRLRHEFGGHCPWFMLTRSLSYDAARYEFLSLVTDPHTISLGTPLYDTDAQGFLQVFRKQDDESSGIVSKSFWPTGNLRTFGSARYVGSIRGMLVASQDGPYHHEAVADSSMSMVMGITPSINGGVRNLQVFKMSVNAQSPTTSTLSHKTLAGTIEFSVTDWRPEHSAFHNGSIGCLGVCGTGADGYGLWMPHLIESGSGTVGTLVRAGTIGMFKDLRDGVEYDFIGFLQDHIPLVSVTYWRRGHGQKPHAPDKALTTRLVYNVFKVRQPGAAGHVFTTLDSSARHVLIQSVSSITTRVHASTFDVARNAGATPLFVKPGITLNLWHRPPELFWAETGFDVSTGYPFITGNATIRPPIAGHASFVGHAGGYYYSDTHSGGFVSTIELDVDFKATGPELSGLLDYEFGGVTGRLAMSGGEWNASEARFRNGKLMCSSGCVSIGEPAAWSGNFVEVSGHATTSLDATEGLLGKFGAVSISHGSDEQLFDAMGIFAAVTGTPASPSPSTASYFPARAYDLVRISVFAVPHLNRLSEQSSTYHRKLMHSRMRDSSLPQSDPNYRVTPTVVKFGDSFVGAGGTIQLSTPLWDWRTGDYANCYCTMFLTGNAFNSVGVELPMGLSASPTMLFRSVDYTQARHGWVGGMWRRDNSPYRWHDLGKTQMDMFVDGTVPDSIPLSGTVSYHGQAIGFASPSLPQPDLSMFPFLNLKHFEKVQGNVELIITLGSHEPEMSGDISLYYESIDKLFILVELDEAEWSSLHKRFYSGTAICYFKHCSPDKRPAGTWEGIFIDTGSTTSAPGGFAGGFSLIDWFSGAEPGHHLEPWDVFGWFFATLGPVDYIIDRDDFLNAPRKSVQIAYQQEFTDFYASSPSTQRLSVVTNSLGTNRRIGIMDLGFVALPSTNDLLLYTKFWRNPLDNNVGPAHFVKYPYTVSLQGNAVFRGDAAGFYTSSADRNGIVLGDVSLSMSYDETGATAVGLLNLDFGDVTSRLTMTTGKKFTSEVKVRDGILTCASGCEGGTGRWTGQLLQLSGVPDPMKLPDGFAGEFGLHGVSIQGDTYDALGLFTAVAD